jgi:tellurite resistance protein TerA
MDLAQKGETASLGGLKQFMVSLKWTTAADFDLAAAYQKKDGSLGMVYFGELGDLNAFPYMQLSGDEGVGDSGGDNEETMRVMKLDDMSYVWIICWDYGSVQTGTPARFSGSDVTVSLMDDSGTNHSVSLDTGDTGNTCLVATIDNTNAMGASFINASKAGTLKGLSSLDQLMSVINS